HREPAWCRGRSLLSWRLLLDVAPRADFETTANPAKLVRSGGNHLGAADGTLGHALGSIGGDRPFGLLQDFRRNHRSDLRKCLSSHKPSFIMPYYLKNHNPVLTCRRIYLT